MTLGEILKTARELKKFSIRQVEEVTNISNSYLSQIENDKIKKPSVDNLYKLSVLYRLVFEDLIHSAGLIEKIEIVPKRALEVLFNSVTNEEEIQLINYLKFMRQK